MTSAWWTLQLFYCEIPFLISAIAATTTSHLTNNNNPNAKIINFEQKNDVGIYRAPFDSRSNQIFRVFNVVLVCENNAKSQRESRFQFFFSRQLRLVRVASAFALILRIFCVWPNTNNKFMWLSLAQHTKIEQPKTKRKNPKEVSLFLSIFVDVVCGLVWLVLLVLLLAGDAFFSPFVSDLCCCFLLLELVLLCETIVFSREKRKKTSIEMPKHTYTQRTTHYIELFLSVSRFTIQYIIFFFLCFAFFALLQIFFFFLFARSAAPLCVSLLGFGFGRVYSRFQSLDLIGCCCLLRIN